MSFSLNKIISKANDILGSDDSAKAKCREAYQAASKGTADLKQNLREKLDAAAEKIAEECTDWTGRETTAEEVKRAAIAGASVGASVAALMAMGPMINAAMRQGRIAARQSANGASSITPEQSGGLLPAMPEMSDEQINQMIEQDAVEYDQMQYDHLQDHLAHQDQLDMAIDDQISYGMDSFDF